MFENRTYRQQHRKKGLVSFDITVKETNLNIQADTNLSRAAIRAVLDCRNTLETYIGLHPDFATAMTPLPIAANGSGLVPEMIPELIRDMLMAAQLAKVGPMAAVAGTMAQYTGHLLLDRTRQVIVENGGDIFVKSDTKTCFTIFAGDSPFSMTCGIEIARQEKPYGICTSSGTLGHSKSYGKADAAMVFSDSCALADAVATSVGNRIRTAKDIQPAIDWGKTIDGIRGIVIIIADKIGVWGEDLKLVRLES